MAVSDQELAISRVYADSILELAQKQGDVDILQHELDELARHAEADSEFGAFLQSPTIDVDQRRLTIDKLFRGKCTDLLVDSLQVMNRKGRLSLVPALALSYRQVREELQGRVQVQVRSAMPLSDAHREALKAVVREQSGKEPDLVETLDAGILGGLIVQVGDKKLDSSVIRKLETLTSRLLERASKEIQGDHNYVVA